MAIENMATAPPRDDAIHSAAVRTGEPSGIQPGFTAGAEAGESAEAGGAMLRNLPNLSTQGTV
jgi:hypothetical protein